MHGLSLFTIRYRAGNDQIGRKWVRAFCVISLLLRDYLDWLSSKLFFLIQPHIQ